MKFYVAQDMSGDIHLFTAEPKRYDLFDKRYLGYWAIKANEGISINITDSLNCRYVKREDGSIDSEYLADLMGFKRKGYKNGILLWKGISQKEAREIEIDFNINILKKI